METKFENPSYCEQEKMRESQSGLTKVYASKDGSNLDIVFREELVSSEDMSCGHVMTYEMSGLQGSVVLSAFPLVLNTPSRYLK